jgi:hypothetical protein
MKAPTIEKTETAAKKQVKTRRSKESLNLCPVDGAGWCAYPFSPAQLERRLKQLAQSAAESKKA